MHGARLVNKPPEPRSRAIKFQLSTVSAFLVASTARTRAAATDGPVGPAAFQTIPGVVPRLVQAIPKSPTAQVLPALPLWALWALWVALAFTGPWGACMQCHSVCTVLLPLYFVPRLHFVRTLHTQTLALPAGTTFLIHPGIAAPRSQQPTESFEMLPTKRKIPGLPGWSAVHRFMRRQQGSLQPANSIRPTERNPVAQKQRTK